MTSATSHITSRAAELRREFDRGFAEPPTAGGLASEGLIAFRLRSQAFAVRLSDIAGVFADKKVTPVPGANVALLGIAGFRGSIVPVYDLLMLLRKCRGDVPRWLMIAANEPVAFAFDAFDGQLRVAPAAIRSQHGDRDTSSYTSEFVQDGSVLRPVVSLSLILGAIAT